MGELLGMGIPFFLGRGDHVWGLSFKILSQKKNHIIIQSCFNYYY